MRYMFIVTTNHQGPPTQALQDAMAKLADREIKAGRMVDNAGLMPVAMGARVPGCASATASSGFSMARSPKPKK